MKKKLLPSVTSGLKTNNSVVEVITSSTTLLNNDEQHLLLHPEMEDRTQRKEKRNIRSRMQPHLKWTAERWKTVLCSDKSKFRILLGKNGHCALWAKEERGHLAPYQHCLKANICEGTALH